MTRFHQLISAYIHIYIFFFRKISKQLVVVNLVQDPAFSLLWLRKITESWVRVAGTLAQIFIGYLSSLSQRVRVFLHPSCPALRSTSFLYNAYRVSFLGIKPPGREINQPPHPASRLKKEWNYTFNPFSALMASSTVWYKTLRLYPNLSAWRFQGCDFQIAIL